MSGNSVVVKSAFSGLYTIYLLCLYKKNKSVRLEVKSLENYCNEIFLSLEKICTKQDLQDLCMEKQRIFEMSNSKSPFFFVASNLYGDTPLKCRLFLQKLNTFYSEMMFL